MKENVENQLQELVSLIEFFPTIAKEKEKALEGKYNPSKRIRAYCQDLIVTARQLRKELIANFHEQNPKKKT